MTPWDVMAWSMAALVVLGTLFVIIVIIGKAMMILDEAKAEAKKRLDSK